MTNQPHTEFHHRLKKVGLVLTAVASLGALIAMIIIAIEKVRSGLGIETYRTMWMVEDNWIGFLIFLVSCLAAAVIALAVRAISWFRARS